MRTLAAILCILAPACSVQCWGPARADEPARVDARQLCAVKRALRHGPVWSPKMCATVAGALNETPDPVMFAAIAVNESGMRERAISAIRPGVYDLGLMQVRCVTVVGAHAQADWCLSSVTTSTDETPTPRDRCTNGAARGIYAHQLLDPTVNIRTAVAVLASHGGKLYRYNGARKPNGYTARVMALVAAWGGELRIPRGAPGPKWARVRALAKRIVEALKGAPRT